MPRAVHPAADSLVGQLMGVLAVCLAGSVLTDVPELLAVLADADVIAVGKAVTLPPSPVRGRLPLAVYMAQVVVVGHVSAVARAMKAK